MPQPLQETTLTFRCERVRPNNGILEILFTKRSGNGGSQQEEHGLFNLLRDRGEPEVGAEYEIIIRRLSSSG